MMKAVGSSSMGYSDWLSCIVWAGPDVETLMVGRVNSVDDFLASFVDIVASVSNPLLLVVTVCA